MKRILGCIALGLATMAASAQWTNPSEDVPAYNASAPVKPLPPVLSGDHLTGIYFTHPYQVTTYKMAAAIPAVLHQQPCYCHCDRVLRSQQANGCSHWLRLPRRQEALVRAAVRGWRRCS